MDVTPIERGYLLQFILDEIQRSQDKLDEVKAKQKSNRKGK